MQIVHCKTNILVFGASSKHVCVLVSRGAISAYLDLPPLEGLRATAGAMAQDYLFLFLYSAGLWCLVWSIHSDAAS